MPLLINCGAVIRCRATQRKRIANIRLTLKYVVPEESIKCAIIQGYLFFSVFQKRHEDIPLLDNIGYRSDPDTDR